MSIKNKSVIIIPIIIVVLIILFILFKNINNKEIKYDYYFSYEKNDNLISQSLYIYDVNGNVISNYYVFNDSKEPIGFALNDNEFATISIAALDLSKKKEIIITFDEDEDIYNYIKVGLKEWLYEKDI